jgi:hypothetical protein
MVLTLTHISANKFEKIGILDHYQKTLPRPACGERGGVRGRSEARSSYDQAQFAPSPEIRAARGLRPLPRSGARESASFAVFAVLPEIYSGRLHLRRGNPGSATFRRAR